MSNKFTKNPVHSKFYLKSDKRLRPCEIEGVRRSVVRRRSSGPLTRLCGSWLPSYAALTSQI
jgi:hypothetical protein